MRRRLIRHFIADNWLPILVGGIMALAIAGAVLFCLKAMEII